MEAIYLGSGEILDHTPASALAAGEVIQLADGMAAVAVADIAANEMGSVRVCGLHDFDSASATVFAIGAEVWWDASANKAITTPGEAADFYLGTATVAKANGQTTVRVSLNAAPEFKNGVIQSRVIEVDCQENAQVAAQNIIPASWNKLGLILIGVYGFITEDFAGAGEDQGIITIEDSDGTDICTLTPSDASADDVNDVIVGTSDLGGAATGDVAKFVAAGKGVQALVTQATAGVGAAGKVKVLGLFARLT